ncbi:hypothetical protein VZT92_007095 [Zoarces viviparus]|uniref:LITAF domain-containing protein n=1 Tax=Zoarces viviparus TaxID=48416 RepID=A0AAW1FIT8_ZOAVI
MENNKNHIKPDISRGDLPVYHVYSVPEHHSRGDGKSVVSCEEKLGRTRGMTTCTSCQQHVMTDITYKVGRFAKQMCVFFAILGLLACVVPMLLLLIPLYVKDFIDVHHTCPLCYGELHIDKKRCCQC